MASGEASTEQRLALHQDVAAQVTNPLTQSNVHSKSRHPNCDAGTADDLSVSCMLGNLHVMVFRLPLPFQVEAGNASAYAASTATGHQPPT